ncbi:RagB/SusD family nutrient uptake outer membrane protein [Flavobacterium sp. KACC 22761]|uniref:RagB/SusD family nutrient uptake outer membrane protein n=1 Tax=Flavobacterium sp. KACC 22761 TaxID=3092665 RepID=UPI002A747333|nr:RagB/SusD family nutrient uptake outer membrane protein [Flavobacterium sp. KACC 22761]WPO76993.1 RagB/SusD family nutrient uptake outer membrane protein [Flavobacterium sp. KACC 22761]
MKNQKIYIFLSMLLAFTVLGCDDVLDTKLDDEIPAATAITDNISLKAAAVGLYDVMQSGTYYGGEFILAQELTSGNADATGFQERFRQLDNAIVPPSNAYIQSNWVNAYSLVNASNLILLKMEELQLKDDNSKGTALFCRALGHFDALRQFGQFTDQNSKYGIPISTKYLDAKSALEVSRSTVAQSYQQIISDLKDAIAILKYDSARFFITKAAAEALLARVYLYQGDYDNAILYASKVISNTAYKLNAKYNDIYDVEGSAEAVFELQFLGIDGNSLTEYLSVSPPEVSANYTNFFKAMDADNDPRSYKYYDSGKQVYCDKYGTRDSEIEGNAIIIKLSEVYLIRAEALAKKNPQNLSLALADLNVVRQRALPTKPYTLASVPNLDAFVSILIEENKRELGFEGHQWFTLVRLGKATSILNIPAFRTTYPIPQNEITIARGKLEQNPGY